MGTLQHNDLFHLPQGINLKDAFVVLVKTEWNAPVVDKLEKGCLRILGKAEAKTKTIVVPGAVEIPFAINRYYQQSPESDKPSAFIALACVVRGDTPHFDYVCQSVASGITQLNLSLPVPVIFGVLTVDTQQQAEERVGGAHGNKGEEAAVTALKMVLFSRQLSNKSALDFERGKGEI